MSIPHVDKFSIPHMDKIFLFIWHKDSLSKCGIDKNVLSILGIDKNMFVYIVYEKESKYHVDKLTILHMYKRFLSIWNIKQI